MNTNDLISEIIIPVILIVITAIIVISIILITIKEGIIKENRKIKKLEENTKKYENIDTSIIYKEIDLSKIKDASILKENIFEMFKVILKAYSDFDNKTLKRLTSDSLYKLYLNKQKKLKDDGEIEVIKNISQNDIRILDIKKKKTDYTIKFYLNISCYNYFVDNKKKRTTRGYDDRKLKQEYLIYLDKIDKKVLVSKIVKVGQKVMDKEKKRKKK